MHMYKIVKEYAKIFLNKVRKYILWSQQEFK